MQIFLSEEPKQRSQICEKILRSLPGWFGIESAILDYIKDVQSMETWIVADSNKNSAVGFLSLCKHNSTTAEIHVMGVLPEFRGKKWGYKLIQAAEKSLQLQGYQFLTVKTLSESRPNKEYDQTRRFYLRYGFSPLEEFKTLWGDANPCLFLAKNIANNIHSPPLPVNNTAIVKNFWQLISNQSWDLIEPLLHENFVTIWPQSKEKIISANNYISINQHYPGNHKVTLIHIFDFGNKVFTTVWIEADTGQQTFAQSLFEFTDGKISRIEEYWAEPYPAPDWRKQWVQLY